MAASLRLLISLTILYAGFRAGCSSTDPQDAAVLMSLRGSWLNKPPNWGESDDPCGGGWEGVTCANTRVAALGLSSLGIKGQLSGDIGGLTKLRSLDLSYNKDLTGPLPARLGDLQNLNILILTGCSFSGNIPDALGKLAELSFFALNSNKLEGRIPPSLGSLSKLYWLDLADNQLSGSIPVSPGLDQLKNAKHFHLNQNQLSGPIPEQLFSPDMILIHALLDNNQFSGPIPSSLGYVRTLEVLRLDGNALSGQVPSNLNDLTSLTELNVAYNKLTGSLPDLSNMNRLNYVDLSNNSFDPSPAPDWFSTLPSLTALIIQYGPLLGSTPGKIFSLPHVQQVMLRNNGFSGNLNITGVVSAQLTVIDLQDNNISSISLGYPYYANTLKLKGNPICESGAVKAHFCQDQLSGKPYSTNLTSCGTKTCPPDEGPSPRCNCAFPYEGTLYFKAPSFWDVSNADLFGALEKTLGTELRLPPGSVYLQNPSFNVDEYLQVQVALFPPTGKFFNSTEIQRIGDELSNQIYKPPEQFGPYYFVATPYEHTLL